MKPTCVSPAERDRTTESNRTAEEIKQFVKERYTAAIQPSEVKSCCGSNTSASGSLSSLLTLGEPHGSKEQFLNLAGYTAEELKAIPQDAAQSSFGCGNPLAFAGVKEGDIVVDIGSGAGIDCFLAAQKVGVSGQVIGVDLTPAMIEKARENAQRASIPNVEFRLGEAEKLPLEDNSADWVISNCVINLAPDKAKVFREIYRVLKPGGRISISDIVVGELPEIIRRSRLLYSSCISGAVSEEEYLQAVRAAGFDDVSVSERFFYGDEVLESFGCSENTRAQLDGFGEELQLLKKFKEQLRHKVASIKVTAQKPALS